MKKEQSGRVFSIGSDYPVIEHCTVSESLYEKNVEFLTIFSMAEETDISKESYPYYKLLWVFDGSMSVESEGGTRELHTGDQLLIAPETLVGMNTRDGVIYAEIGYRKETQMKGDMIKSGEVFRMSELLPYSDGKIVNMDLAHNSKMKFMIMSFDEGTGLSEHSAPGEAFVFALEGEAVIGYEGTEHLLKAGEQFKFAKGGRHSVSAKGKFKMALLLMLE